jgi:hypothetical protein
MVSDRSDPVRCQWHVLALLSTIHRFLPILLRDTSLRVHFLGCFFLRGFLPNVGPLDLPISLRPTVFPPLFPEPLPDVRGRLINTRRDPQIGHLVDSAGKPRHVPTAVQTGFVHRFIRAFGIGNLTIGVYSCDAESVRVADTRERCPFTGGALVGARQTRLRNT